MDAGTAVTEWPIYVKRAHVALLHYIWIEMLPVAYPWLTLENAWETWARYRENPADPRLKHIKMAVRELWDLHVQTN